MKSLVTGAAGFIGSHLVEKLLGAGHVVVGVDSFLDNYPRHFKESNLAHFHQRPQFTFVGADLTRTDLTLLLQGVDYVFHLAGQPGVRSSWGREFSRYTENNISATQLLLEAAKDKKVSKFVYASTSSVYGDTTDLPMRADGLTGGCGSDRSAVWDWLRGAAYEVAAVSRENPGSMGQVRGESPA